MLDLIEKLRAKPLAYRKRFLLLSTSVITGLIFVVWFSTFNLGLNINTYDAAAIEKQLKPVDEIKTNVIGFYETVKKASQEIFGSTATSS